MISVKGPRFDRVASKDSSQSYTIVGALVSPAGRDHVYVSVTDGHILGVLRTEGTIGEPSIMPPEVISKRQGGAKYRLDDGVWYNATESKYGLQMPGRYPHVPHVLPMPDGLKKTVVGIDAKRLARLASMVSTDGKVVLMIGKPNKPIAVRGDGGFGVIMPCVGDADETAADDYYKDRAAYEKAWPKPKTPKGQKGEAVPEQEDGG